MDGGTTINSVSVADEEIKVISSAMPAEYGHATAGALLVVKKAGTNSLTARAASSSRTTPWSIAVSSADDQPATGHYRPVPNARFRGQRTGDPHVYNGKNKTFFEVAGSYHMDSSSNASSYTVPTTAMLGGDFSAYTNQLYDPGSTAGTYAAGNLSRTLFPGNIIPKSRFSSMWNAIAANNPFIAPKRTPAAYSATAPAETSLASGTGHYYNLTNQVRIDHSFTDKFKMFGSFTGQPTSARDQRRHHLPAVRSVPGIHADPPERGHRRATYTISPTLISETRVGEYRRTQNPTSPGADFEFTIAKTVPNLPANVYLNPVGFGLSRGQ